MRYYQLLNDAEIEFSDFYIVLLLIVLLLVLFVGVCIGVVGFLGTLCITCLFD